MSICKYFILFSFIISQSCFASFLNDLPVFAYSKDTVTNLMIIDENSDSVVYNPDKGKNQKANQNNEKTKEDATATNSIDFFLKKLKTAEQKNDKKEIVRLLDSIATHYSNLHDYNNAIAHYQKLLKIKTELGDKRGASKTLSGIATSFYAAGKTDDAINAYNEAIKLRKELKDKEEEVILLNELATVYQTAYKTDEAIKTYEKGLAIRKDMNDDKGVAVIINSIGNLYFENNKINRAISFYEQNLEIEKKTNDKLNIAASLNNLGIAHFKNGDRIKASDLFQKALDLYKELNDKKGISSALNNLANLYYDQKDFTKSIENYETSLKLKNEMKDEAGLAIIKFNLANIYREKNDLKKAAQLFEESYTIAKKVNIPDVIAKNIIQLAQVYAGQNNFKKSAAFYKLYFESKQALLQEDKEEQISMLQEKYRIEKEINRLTKRISKQDLLTRVYAERARQEIMIKNLELSKKEELVKQQYILNILAGAVLIIIFVSLILLFRQFKKLKKANRLLWTQKTEIETKKKELETANLELNKLSIVASKTDNAIVLMDKNGKFEWVNEGFTRLYGYSLDTLIEKRGENLISASENPQVKIAVMSCIKQKTTVKYETHYPDASGKKIWTQTTLTPVPDSNGDIIKLVAIDSDITIIKNAQEEIKLQNELIELRNNEIKKQRDIATRQRDEIGHQKAEITDGIIYAQHIQSAILPPEDYLLERLPNHFVLWMPRDIVSGDFYWVRRIEHQILFTAADCTGHGVPAAFMSMLGTSLLNEIINNYMKDAHLLKPSQILEELREKVINSLHQTGKIGGANDGMDMALCVLDTRTNKLQYAGANCPLYIIPANKTFVGRNFQDVLEFPEGQPGVEIKPDKMPISIHPLAVGKNFTNKEFQLQKGDAVYIFSDGYIDQFGGPKYMKFRHHRFKSLLIDIFDEPMQKQKIILEETHKKWRGSMEQIDDILVMGVKI